MSQSLSNIATSSMHYDSGHGLHGFGHHDAQDSFGSAGRAGDIDGQRGVGDDRHRGVTPSSFMVNQRGFYGAPDWRPPEPEKNASLFKPFIEAGTGAVRIGGNLTRLQNTTCDVNGGFKPQPLYVEAHGATTGYQHGVGLRARVFNGFSPYLGNFFLMLRGNFMGEDNIYDSRTQTDRSLAAIKGCFPSDQRLNLDTDVTTLLLGHVDEDIFPDYLSAQPWIPIAQRKGHIDLIEFTFTFLNGLFDTRLLLANSFEFERRWYRPPLRILPPEMASPLSLARENRGSFEWLLATLRHPYRTNLTALEETPLPSSLIHDPGERLAPVETLAPQNRLIRLLKRIHFFRSEAAQIRIRATQIFLKRNKTLFSPVFWFNWLVEKVLAVFNRNRHWDDFLADNIINEVAEIENIRSEYYAFVENLSSLSLNFAVKLNQAILQWLPKPVSALMQMSDWPMARGQSQTYATVGVKIVRNESTQTFSAPIFHPLYEEDEVDPSPRIRYHPANAIFSTPEALNSQWEIFNFDFFYENRSPLEINLQTTQTVGGPQGKLLQQTNQLIELHVRITSRKMPDGDPATQKSEVERLSEFMRKPVLQLLNYKPEQYTPTLENAPVTAAAFSALECAEKAIESINLVAQKDHVPSWLVELTGITFMQNFQVSERASVQTPFSSQPFPLSRFVDAQSASRQKVDIVYSDDHRPVVQSNNTHFERALRRTPSSFIPERDWVEATPNWSKEEAFAGGKLAEISFGFGHSSPNMPAARVNSFIKQVNALFGLVDSDDSEHPMAAFRSFRGSSDREHREIILRQKLTRQQLVGARKILGQAPKVAHAIAEEIGIQPHSLAFLRKIFELPSLQPDASPQGICPLPVTKDIEIYNKLAQKIVAREHNEALLLVAFLDRLAKRTRLQVSRPKLVSKSDTYWGVIRDASRLVSDYVDCPTLSMHDSSASIVERWGYGCAHITRMRRIKPHFENENYIDRIELQKLKSEWNFTYQGLMRLLWPAGTFAARKSIQPRNTIEIQYHKQITATLREAKSLPDIVQPLVLYMGGCQDLRDGAAALLQFCKETEDASVNASMDPRKIASRRKKSQERFYILERHRKRVSQFLGGKDSDEALWAERLGCWPLPILGLHTGRNARHFDHYFALQFEDVGIKKESSQNYDSSKDADENRVNKYSDKFPLFVRLQDFRILVEELKKAKHDLDACASLRHA